MFPMRNCCHIEQLIYATWDDSGFAWDAFGLTWNGTMAQLMGYAIWADHITTWDAITHDWQGKEYPLIPQLQIKDDDLQWENPRPASEAAIITEHWREAFPPEAVTCWAIQWATGDIVYYRWIMVNPCIGCNNKPHLLKRLLHA